MAEVHYIVENINKIIAHKKLTKMGFADLVGFPDSKWSKISNGRQELSLHEFSKIANNLQMREIDILTWPQKFVDSESFAKDVSERVSVTFEVSPEKRDELLKLVMGEKKFE